MMLWYNLTNRKKTILNPTYKWKNQRGRIDSLLLWVSRLSASQTELSERQCPGASDYVITGDN